MTLVVYTAAAAEPLSVAEVMAHCRIDAGSQEPAPGVLTCALAAPAAPGNVDNGAHRYRVTFVTADGETQAGAASAAVTVADKAVNGQVALTGIPIGGTLVTARKIYRTAAGGSVYLYHSTLANNIATTATDNLADSGLGAEAPSVNTTNDPLIGLLIASARAAAEQELRRYLVTQTLDAYFDAFPSAAPYEILLPPLQSVTSISYVDTDGATQTVSSVDYLVDAKSRPARITPAYGLAWPSTRQQQNAVVVRFVAGYGAASAVPQCIKNWMLLRIGALWDNRSQLVIGVNGLVEIPCAFIDSLLDPERVAGRI